MTPRDASAQLAAAIDKGRPSPLGATPTALGVNFAIHSSPAEAVELCLFERGSGIARGGVRLPARTGDIWHGHLPASLAAAGDLYAYRVHGPYSPERGLRCNPRKLLLDPCARAISHAPRLAASLFDGGASAALDSVDDMPRCRIVAQD